MSSLCIQYALVRLVKGSIGRVSDIGLALGAPKRRPGGVAFSAQRCNTGEGGQGRHARWR